MIRSLRPQCPRYACSLRGDDNPVLVVVDNHKRQKPKEAESLLKELSKQIVMQPNRTGSTEEWPRSLVLQGRTWALEHFCFHGKCQGALGAIVPEGTSDESLNSLRTLLLVCCLRLGHRLEAESYERRRIRVEQEIAELGSLADLGELTGPVTHELRNFLNSVLLHIAVLQQEAPEDSRRELDEIRGQGREISTLLTNLQEHHSTQSPVLDAADLNLVVRKTAEGLQAKAAGAGQLPIQICDSRKQSPGPAPHEHNSIQLSLDLTSDRLPVPARCTDLKRLCTFMVRNAIAAANVMGRCVKLRTERAADNALLCVEHNGPLVSPADLAQVFEPHATCRARTSNLELAACRSLVRRLQGTIKAESGSENGLRLTVLLPLSLE
jgi:signal transduction histidine kinase